MKTIFGLNPSIAFNDYDILNWYHRDTKRIKRGIAWNSGVYKKTQDDKYIIEIMNKNRSSEFWVVSMYYNKTTNTTRIQPLGKVAKIYPSGYSNYFYYTLAH